MKSVARFSLLLLLFIAAASHAHDARPNYVQVTETTPNTYSVMWKVPASMPGASLPYPTFPEDCVAERQAAWREAGAEYMGQQVFVCESGLSSRTVGIRFPVINPSLSTLYKVRLANGEEHVKILKPGDNEWTVPDAESRFGVAREPTWLLQTSSANVRHVESLGTLLRAARIHPQNTDITNTKQKHWHGATNENQLTLRRTLRSNAIFTTNN